MNHLFIYFRILLGSSILLVLLTGFSFRKLPKELLKRNKIKMLEGQVYVCSNKWCREKGSDATMATFGFLCPDTIPILGVNCLGKCNKGPNARILTRNGTFVDVSMVRSVETVVQLLKTHLYLDVNTTSAEVLRLNYEGNIHLRNGNIGQAIDCYNLALQMGDKEQEGVLLVMRGTALLQRCYSSRLRYKDLMLIAQGVLPSIDGITSTLQSLNCMHPVARYSVTMELLLRADAIFDNLDFSNLWSEVKTKWPESREGKVVKSGSELLSKAMFSWYIYEHSLTLALQDLLAATIVLPGFAQAWRRTGDALSEMMQFKSAIEYYDIAMKLDSTLVTALSPTVERLKVLEKVLDNAEAKGWPIESVLSLIDD